MEKKQRELIHNFNGDGVVMGMHNLINLLKALQEAVLTLH